jgi:inner membrane protein
MQKMLFVKLAAVAVLSLLLLVPLFMIEAQIAGRSVRQAEVVRNIAESAAGPQTLIGPVLAVRYRERIERRGTDESGDGETVRHEIVERTEMLPPRRLDIGGEARVETRSRGLYRARLYHLALQVSGDVVVPPHLGLAAGRNIVDAQAFLVLGVADPRGVDNDPDLRINGGSYRFATGTGGFVAGQGVHVPLGSIDPAKGGSFAFALPLNLTGSERLAIAPAGDATSVTLKSDWPHPSFQGRFLPTTRSVSGAGFEANWQVSHLARSFERILAPPAAGESGETLDVSFMDPVNVYLQSERAVKYGILFVVLTFAAFFLTEILRRLSIHPLQYLLVGLALAIFFLLLIALSEHFSFAIAYAVSAAACVSLIGAYLAGALGSVRRGAAFGAGIAALYGVLYGVLLSEDNALLMGSLVLFAALGATMLATRKIDWYRIGAAAGDRAR